MYTSVKKSREQNRLTSIHEKGFQWAHIRLWLLLEEDAQLFLRQFPPSEFDDDLGVEDHYKLEWNKKTLSFEKNQQTLSASVRFDLTM